MAEQYFGSKFLVIYLFSQNPWYVGQVNYKTTGGGQAEAPARRVDEVLRQRWRWSPSVPRARSAADFPTEPP